MNELNLHKGYLITTVPGMPTLSFCSWHSELLTALGMPGAPWNSLYVNHIHYTPCLAKIYIEIQSIQANYICKAPFGLAKI